MDMIANPLYFFSGTPPTPPSSSNVVRFIDILDFFFVAHPSSGRKECEEHKRVMFFHPKGENIDRQTEVTGFAEAVVNFTDNFLPASEHKVFNDDETFDYRTVSTKKTEQIYVRVEENQFILGVSLLKELSDVSDYPLCPIAIRSILCDAYKTFRMFFGTFSSFKVSEDETKLKDRLDFFFSRYVPLMKVHKIPLLDHLGGVEFLRMSGPIYLNIVSLINELQEEFPLIEKIMFLYQDKLLYYQLSKRDLPSLFRYLTQNLLTKCLAPELEPNSRSSAKGRYLQGPSDLSSDSPLIGDESLPVIHLHVPKDERNIDNPEDEEILVRYQMIVYRILNATVCMFVRHQPTSESSSREDSPTSQSESPKKNNGIISRRLLNNINLFLETELAEVANKIGEEISKSDFYPEASDYHYIYYNPSSLSMTSSLSIIPPYPLSNLSELTITSSSLSKIGIPPREVNRLVCDTLNNFVSDTEEFGECFVKSELEWWIVVKKVNSRLLVLMIPISTYTSSLADVQSKTTTIVKSHFEAIFFR